MPLGSVCRRVRSLDLVRPSSWSVHLDSSTSLERLDAHVGQLQGATTRTGVHGRRATARSAASMAERCRSRAAIDLLIGDPPPLA